MTIQLTTTHRRIVGAVMGAWLGIQLTTLSGVPALILGLPLLGALVFGVLDRTGRLLGPGFGVCAGLITAEVVFTFVYLVGGGDVSRVLLLPLELCLASVLGVTISRSIRSVPALQVVPAPAQV
ncbi:MAG: hypothetical protein OEY70_02775 [Acidimicrobiia bacterium]|nr:hypothetical protein [Acidimicrobiia bacterium]